MNKEVFIGRPGTVFDGGDPAAPLPDAASVAGTPALQAIRQGLGRYLETQGYVAEHPLLYVNETSDPFVYVRFDISDDGLGFLDTTYVYSPSVSQQIDEVFEAYDAYGPDEARTPHTSAMTMLGRPVHASMQGLRTYSMEEEFRRNWEYQRVASRRPKRGRWARRKLVKAARARMKRTGSASPPKFGRRRGFSYPEVMGCGFLALSLNWDIAQDSTSEMWSNWRVGDDRFQVACDCERIWKENVERRLIQASPHGGENETFTSWIPGGIPENCWFSGADLGEEWTFHDPLYWAMKAVYEGEYFRDSMHFSPQFLGYGQTLYAEFEYFSFDLECVVIRWISAQSIDDVQSARDHSTQLEVAALRDEQVRDAMQRFRRFAAIIANRNGIPGGPDWRLKAQRLQNDTHRTAESIVRAYVDDFRAQYQKL